jgi:thiamine-phosphate pyrophosphorylase
MTLSMPHHRQRRRLPKRWFFTDDRLAGAEASIIARLPPGTGVVLRNYLMPNRSVWAKKLVHLCRERRLVVLIAGNDKLAWSLRADGVHWPEKMARAKKYRRHPHWLITGSAHTPAGLHGANCVKADAVFLAPVFETRSHPGKSALGCIRAGLLIRRQTVAVIALGGVNRISVKKLRGRKFYGWAAIDGWRS